MPACSCRRKEKNKWRISLIFGCFCQVLYLKIYEYEWWTVLWHVGGENKIKADLSIFFPCRAYF